VPAAAVLDACLDPDPAARPSLYQLDTALAGLLADDDR
jgi:hypothetical protein